MVCFKFIFLLIILCLFSVKAEVALEKNGTIVFEKILLMEEEKAEIMLTKILNKMVLNGKRRYFEVYPSDSEFIVEKVLHKFTALSEKQVKYTGKRSEYFLELNIEHVPEKEFDDDLYKSNC